MSSCTRHDKLLSMAGVTTCPSAIFNFIPEWAFNFYAAMRR